MASELTVTQETVNLILRDLGLLGDPITSITLEVNFVTGDVSVTTKEICCLWTT